jgi:hypothetical protein
MAGLLGTLALIAVPAYVLAADPVPQAAAAPNADPGPAPDPAPPPAQDRFRAPDTMNLFVGPAFRNQNGNWAACTAASAQSMLNFISVQSTGGDGFLWRPTTSASVRDRILSWERRRDTLPGGYGSDPHGWRNALNYFGWGAATMYAGSRVYDDVSFSTYEGAMKSAVRALASTGKPVGLLAWRGAHAQMVTGYFGLTGDPFDKDENGRFTNAFSVGGFYLTDPRTASNAVNRAISYTALRVTMNYKLRFQRYYENDSRYDDPYTPGYRPSRTEWYGRFVLVMPIR